MKIKVIVVDDHEFFRKGVIMTLEQFDFVEVTGEFAKGIDYLKYINDFEADIVLMDIKMPEKDGIETTKEALTIQPDLKIVALSMFGDEDYLISMLEAGVQGFLLKNIDKEGLKRAIKQVYSGKQFFSEELIPLLTKQFTIKAPENSIQLSSREHEVLKLVAKGLKNNEIADELCLSTKTIVNHRSNIISKTGCNNTASLIVYAIKNKLINLND